MKKTTTMTMNPNQLKPSPELMEIQKIMPIANDDRERLQRDIEDNGVRDAIKVYQTEDGEFLILGGMNRWEIALDAALETVPIDIYKGDKESYRQLVKDDNLNRRHLTNRQKIALIGLTLVKSPEKSNRQIARESNTNHATVGKVRKIKEESGEIEKQTATIGKDGKSRTTDIKREPVVKASAPKKIIKCPHCGKDVEI